MIKKIRWGNFIKEYTPKPRIAKKLPREINEIFPRKDVSKRVEDIKNKRVLGKDIGTYVATALCKLIESHGALFKKPKMVDIRNKYKEILSNKAVKLPDGCLVYTVEKTFPFGVKDHGTYLVVESRYETEEILIVVKYELPK